jgi:hypothetical protein
MDIWVDFWVHSGFFWNWTFAWCWRIKKHLQESEVYGVTTNGHIVVRKIFL